MSNEKGAGKVINMIKCVGGGQCDIAGDEQSGAMPRAGD